MRYATGMRVRLTLFLVVLVSCVAAASPAGRLGDLFADTYGTFAPIYRLYRFYADYLFAGTTITEIPSGTDVVCQAYTTGLEELQIALVTQTASRTTESLAYLVRLRGDWDAFCKTFGDALTLISTRPVELSALETLAAQGMFAEVGSLNDAFEKVLTAVLDGMAVDRGRWDFAVAFSMRTILESPREGRLSSGLREILLGGDASSMPAFPVSDEVTGAILRLAAWSGAELSEEEWTLTVEAAEQVWTYFVAG